MKRSSDDRRSADRVAELDAREDALDRREAAIAEREERQFAREPGEEREHMVAQMREANEHLVLATIHANEMVEECRRRSSEIAASEERFRSIVITSTAILFHANEEGRIRVDPSSWCRLTGLDAGFEEEQEPGWGWLHAVPPDDQARVRAAWARATATGHVYTLEHRLLKPDGSYAWVVARAVPLARNGKVREWVGTMTDISDRVRVEEARDHFIAVLGHDLRNPVSAILLSSDLLTETRQADEVQKTGARVARSAARIDAMIRDMLDFARGRLGHGIPIARRPCDLGQIARSEVDELRQAYPDRTITCESAGDLTGEWDSDRLEQVFSNLIGNALDHAKDAVVVRLSEQGTDVVLTVHNRGMPVPPGQIATMFEPYRRKLGDPGKGLGLGLYIVSQIIRAHEATISVRSEQDHGTTFTVRLPRRARAGSTASSGILQRAVEAALDRGEDK